MTNSIALLREHTASAANVARSWFNEMAISVDRLQFDKRGGLSDTKEGAVYVYFTQSDDAVYVGQTGRGIKARLYDQTSPHARKDWWSTWEKVKFVQLPEKMDRLLLEFLLILAYAPKENRSPRAIGIDELFCVK